MVAVPAIDKHACKGSKNEGGDSTGEANHTQQKG
jgi:hypothetical protein